MRRTPGIEHDAVDRNGRPRDQRPMGVAGVVDEEPAFVALHEVARAVPAYAPRLRELHTHDDVFFLFAAASVMPSPDLASRPTLSRLRPSEKHLVCQPKRDSHFVPSVRESKPPGALSSLGLRTTTGATAEPTVW